jgi:hypothetical protein
MLKFNFVMYISLIFAQAIKLKQNTRNYDRSKKIITKQYSIFGNAIF